MLQAIFGLVGVIIGGVVTAGFQLFQAWRRQERDQRLAARILRDELGWWWSNLKDAIESRDFSGIDHPGSVAEAWQQYRGALIDLSGPEWSQLHLAVRASNLDLTDAPPKMLPSAAAGEIQKQVDRLDACITMLEKYTR
jgi:hypothetical protein